MLNISPRRRYVAGIALKSALRTTTGIPSCSCSSSASLTVVSVVFVLIENIICVPDFMIASLLSSAPICIPPRFFISLHTGSRYSSSSSENFIGVPARSSGENVYICIKPIGLVTYTFFRSSDPGISTERPASSVNETVPALLFSADDPRSDSELPHPVIMPSASSTAIMTAKILFVFFIKPSFLPEMPHTSEYPCPISGIRASSPLPYDIYLSYCIL